MEKFIKELIKNGFEKLFELDKLKFNKVIISKSILEEFILHSKNAYPKEFLAFLEGKIEDNKLILNKLIYHQFESSNNTAVPIFHFNNISFFGTAHSHPSYNNNPSRADLNFFRKYGIVHCILCKPYEQNNLKFFNHDGEEIIVEIVEEI